MDGGPKGYKWCHSEFMYIFAYGLEALMVVQIRLTPIINFLRTFDQTFRFGEIITPTYNLFRTNYVTLHPLTCKIFPILLRPCSTKPVGLFPSALRLSGLNHMGGLNFVTRKYTVTFISRFYHIIRLFSWATCQSNFFVLILPQRGAIGRVFSKGAKVSFATEGAEKEHPGRTSRLCSHRRSSPIDGRCGELHQRI